MQQLWRRTRIAPSERANGFTLVELLVVMIIIGVLAAIAIPSFQNHRRNGYRALMKHDLRLAVQEIEMWAMTRTDGVGYVGLDSHPWTSAKFGLDEESVTRWEGSAGVTVKVSNKYTPTETTYCLRSSHDGVPDVWRFKKGVDRTPIARQCHHDP